MAGGKRANKIQVSMRVPSGRNRNGWHRSMNMGLDLAPLTTETGKSPENHDPRYSRHGLREVSKRHGSQDERNHQVAQTVPGGVPEA